MEDVYSSTPEAAATASPSIPLQDYDPQGDAFPFEAYGYGYLDALNAFDVNPALTAPVPNSRLPSPIANSGDGPNVASSPMSPPAVPRKRKAPTLKAADWEPYKARIIELHIDHNRPLPEVKDTIEKESGFVAEIRQYRRRLSQWRLDKNIKPQEMKAIVRKQQTRKLTETEKNPLRFMVRGNSVDPEKVERWKKRNNVLEDMAYEPNFAADTPSAVSCYTQSMAPSPMDSMENQRFSMEGSMSVPQTPQPQSPTPSITSVLEPQFSSFTGQSPAPINVTTPVGFTGVGPAEHRYRENEEARLRQKLFDAPHSDNHDTLMSLGQLMMYQGRYKSAEELIRRVIGTAQDMHGHDHENTVDALDLLGKNLKCEGLLSQSEKVYRRACSSRKNTQGPEHPKTLRSIHGLAMTWHQQGRYTEAEKLQSENVKISERVLGHDHPDTLRRKNSLASIYLGQKRSSKAENLNIQVLHTSERVLGRTNPDTLAYMGYLARTYWEQGRYDKAEQLQAQGLQTWKRILGEEHPHTLVSKHNLATVFFKQRRYVEAEELTSQCLESSIRVLGEEHPGTLLSADWLAEIYEAQKRFPEAQELRAKVDSTTSKRGGKYWI